MIKENIFLYPGQGSQYYNMYSTLMQKNEVFSFYMKQLNDEYKNISGISILDELYNNNKNMSNHFEELEFTHPSIYMIQYAISNVLIDKGIVPSAVIGSSLGELAASSIAGMTNYKDMLWIINKQVKLIKEKCAFGGMLAVIDNYENYIYDENVMNYGTIASINFDNHFVISALSENLIEIEKYFKKREITTFKLPVKYPFHSNEMNVIKKEFLEVANTINYKMPKIKYYSTTTGDLVNSINGEYLFKVICRPMNLIRLFNNIDYSQNKFIDIGPSATMKNFVKYNNKHNYTIQNYAINSPLQDELEQINKIIKELSEEN